MRKTIHVATTVMLVVLVAAQSAIAQTAPDVWRSFAERLDVGTELTVRLNDGRSFSRHARGRSNGRDAVATQNTHPGGHSVGAV